VFACASVVERLGCNIEHFVIVLGCIGVFGRRGGDGGGVFRLNVNVRVGKSKLPKYGKFRLVTVIGSFSMS
jgi:hypothetical protein